jgi:hypothetical protein
MRDDVDALMVRMAVARNEEAKDARLDENPVGELESVLDTCGSVAGMGRIMLLRKSAEVR